MQKRPPRSITRSGPRAEGRSGFTLLEILIVIIIISILIALLVPVLANIQQSGQVAKVKTEISQISTAIVAFKNTYGIEPPSRFVLFETFSDYDVDVSGTDPILDRVRLKSRSAITRMWPQFDFTGSWNWDGGSLTGPYVLNGSESLLFFLGGMIETGPNLTGFSKNPAAPFSTGGSREGPFLEFSTSRIQDNIVESDGGNTGIFEYLDPLEGQTRPYQYIHSSSYKDHDPNEFTNPPLTAALTPFAYRQNDGARSYYKPNTYQIVSPGFDGLYGNGGIYEEDSTAHDGTALHIDDGDKDNITNFSSGMLRQ